MNVQVTAAVYRIAWIAFAVLLLVPHFHGKKLVELGLLALGAAVLAVARRFSTEELWAADPARRLLARIPSPSKNPADYR
jgi:hypothetical protein